MDFGKLQFDPSADGAKRLKELRSLKEDLLRQKNSVFVLFENFDKTTESTWRRHELLKKKLKIAEMVTVGKMDLRREMEEDTQFAMYQMDILLEKFTELKKIGDVDEISFV